MLEVSVTCAMCGVPQPKPLLIETVSELAPAAIKARIETVTGWCVEFNGDHMDTYCSVSCAKWNGVKPGRN